MSGILLDTHVWIWYITGSNELGKSVCKTINAGLQNNAVHIAAISLWEVGMLEARKRIVLNVPCLEWINESIDLAKIRIVQLTPAIAVESCSLPGNFHEDPADRMIVAAARVERLKIITRDSRILAYSKHNYISAISA